MLMLIQATAGLRALGAETSEKILQAVIMLLYSSGKKFILKLERAIILMFHLLCSIAFNEFLIP